MEVIAASAITGAPVRIVHLNSTSVAATPRTGERLTRASFLAKRGASA